MADRYRFKALWCEWSLFRCGVMESNLCHRSPRPLGQLIIDSGDWLQIYGLVMFS